MSVHVVGQIPDFTRSAVDAAIHRTGAKCEFHASRSGFARAVQRTTEAPTCVIAKTPDLGGLVDWVRDQGALFHVPIIALTPFPTQSAFRECLDMGVEDVVLLHDTAGLTRRVASLTDVDARVGRPPVSASAVVCLPDGRRRRLLGRALRQAGYDLTFASTLEDVMVHLARQSPVDILVISAACLREGVTQSIRRLRALSVSRALPVVVTGRADSAERFAIGGVPAVTFMSDESPTADMLFFVNELLASAPARDLRRSPRLLLPVLCSFRPSGSISPSYGLTYNVSRDGVFVRTLDPLPKDTWSWLEMRLADDEPAVHVRGSVVWVRRPNPSEPSPTPPGFGVRLDLVMSPQPDVKRYLRVYDALRAEHERTSQGPGAFVKALRSGPLPVPARA
jgi:CheY-like chemotaxis protein